MKTQNFDLSSDIFKKYALSIEEMIDIRGGELDPITLPMPLPIKI